MNRRYQSFTEFWPFYVAEHSKPGTRWLHFAGTVVGTLTMFYLVLSGRWWLFPLGLIPGYGGAWFGHFFIEKNKPATFQYPLWSFISDYKMIGLMITGRMNEELARVKQGGM